MTSLQLDTGGRPVANDDFQVLQDRDAVLGLPALLSGLGPCVVSGCRVYQTGSQYNVGAGMVWDGTQLLPFTGRSNVALPAMFAPGAVVVVDERAYQTGGTKTTIRGQDMDLVPVVAGAGNLVMNAWGCLRWNDVVRASVRYLGEIQPMAVAGYVSTDYDADGLGKSGSAAWGWGLCNGQGSREDLRTLTVAGASDANVEYAAGTTGGKYSVALLTANLPPNPAGTRNVATFNGGDKNLVASGNNGWGGAQPLAGIGQSFDTRSPFRALPYRQWVGY